MSRWYEPHEQWPRHQKPWWRETIDAARSAGWHLQTVEGHAWGRLVCDRDADKPCKIAIFSTGTGGESAALTARRNIERCDHHAAAEAGQVQFKAVGLLDRAEALLEAAGRCLQAAGRRAEAEELLRGAATAVDEAEKLAQAVSREEDSDRLVVEAFAVLPEGSELGCPPTAAEVGVLIVSASTHADEAQQLTDSLPTGSPADALKARIEQVRTRVTDLSSHLERGWNANGASSA
ncbi:hypothetical protein [Streptomyces sp. NPDC091215]|uniref:hypothetical protein n=1 Tax=Streptomyces sp. NPDC091215 TaxID=3155192 RepID=UPI0034174C6C